MTIHLPPRLENPILAAVHSGRYASLEDAMTEAASLLVQRLELEQIQATAPDSGKPPQTDSRTPIWERIIERSAAIPDEDGTNCRSTVPSSTTTTSMARRNGPRRHEAVVCRRDVLDRHCEPQRSVACESRAGDAVTRPSDPRYHRGRPWRVSDVLQRARRRSTRQRCSDRPRLRWPIPRSLCTRKLINRSLTV